MVAEDVPLSWSNLETRFSLRCEYERYASEPPRILFPR